MKQWFSIVSICMVAVFLFSSVLQFHHHDADGNIAVFESCDSHGHNDNHTCLFHQCSHHNQNHTADDDDCCTLKLSTQQASRPTNIQHSELCFSLLFIGILNHTISEFFADNSTPHFIVSTIGYISAAKYHVSGLRAPPFVL
ncbi:MAG: hypothetical protein ACI4UN_09175 [Muribaculaceae bacterium]